MRCQPGPPPHASVAEEPKLFEILGTDVFDYYVHEVDGVEQKFKFILWKAKASGLMFVEF